jgi:hypothetical protein
MRELMRAAMIQPADAQAHEAPKGLEGVVVADTPWRRSRAEGFITTASAVDLASRHLRTSATVVRGRLRRHSPNA